MIRPCRRGRRGEGAAGRVASNSELVKAVSRKQHDCEGDAPVWVWVRAAAGES
jgi:hypothetical protein